METLSSMRGKFTLSEKKDSKVQIGEDRAAPLSTRGKSCLVGKLLVNSVVPKDFIRVHMLRAWKTLGSVSFKVLGDNLFLIEFEQAWEKPTC
jgi:hypothetical protein